MNRIISRPARGLLSLALAVCTVFIPGAGERALRLMAAVLLARLLSLCAGSAFRAAAGSVINSARLRGNFLTALICTIAGGLLTTVLCTITGIHFLSGIGIYTAAAGALINIAQLCCDRLYAAFDNFSPPLYDIIIAALAAAALLISASDAWLLPACVLPAAAAGGILLAGLRSGSAIKPGFATLKYAPLALLSGGIFQCLPVAFAIYFNADVCGIAITLAAVALIDLCESPFRRIRDESSTVTLCIAISAIASALCARFITVLPNNYMSNFIAACLAVLLTGTILDLRHIFIMAAILVLSAVTAHPSGAPGLICMIAASAALIALCIPDAQSMQRIARARRLQRRRTR